MEAQSSRRTARERWRGIIDWFNGLELSENAILISFSLAIGVFSALGVAAFYKSIDYAYALFYRLPVQLAPGLAAYAYRPSSRQPVSRPRGGSCGTSAAVTTA
jgi:hypothetical protein